MTVIITGAGRVGMAAASVATRIGSVVIMEKDSTKADAAQSLKNTSVLRNDASNPKTLENAIRRFNPSAIVTAVDQDSTNIFICSMVKRFSPKITTIATIKDSDYLLGHEGIPGVDSIIAPRITAADRLAACTLMENVVSFYRIDRLGLCFAIFRVEKGSKFSGRYVMDILVEGCSILAIYRGDSVITSVYSCEIHDGDRIAIIGFEGSIKKFNSEIGVSRPVRNITILGAGNLGQDVATAIIQAPERHIVKIIDKDLALCNIAARSISGAVVVNGNTSDPVFLRSENVDRADAVISVSDSEEENLLICVNAFRFGVKKIVSQYTTEEYGELLRYSGIECILGYHNVIINETADNLISEGADQSFVFDRSGEVLLMITADESMSFIGKPLGDVYFPEGIRLAVIMRNNSPIFPGILDRVLPGDRLVFFVSNYDPVEITHLFGRPFMGL